MSEFNIRAKNKSILETIISEFKIKRDICTERDHLSDKIDIENQNIINLLQSVIDPLAFKYKIQIYIDLCDEETNCRITLSDKNNISLLFKFIQPKIILHSENNLRKFLIGIEARLRWTYRFILKDKSILNFNGKKKSYITFKTRTKYYV